MDHLLSLLVFSPLIGGFLLFLVRKDRTPFIKGIGVLATVPPFVLSFIFFFQSFVEKTTVRLTEKRPWIRFTGVDMGDSGIQQADPTPTFSIDYELQLDGLSLTFITLTTLLTLLAAILSWQIGKNRKGYFLLLLFLETGILGLFAAGNLFLFFLFFEFTVVAMFFLVGKWGGVARERAAYQFLLYNGAGSALLLFALIVLFVQTGTVNTEQLQHLLGTESASGPEFGLSGAGRWGVFLPILLAFAVKMPVVPFHPWMVTVHKHAHPAIVIIHSGILLKIATYGFVKFGIGLFPSEWERIDGILVSFAFVNIFYGALLALRQTDLRKVWAYSSVSHMGFVLLGLGLLNGAGIQGALFQSVSHGLISGLLFLVVAILYHRFKTMDIRKISGLREATPFTLFLLFVGGMAAIGLPGTTGFIGEFTVIFAAFQQHVPIGVVAALAIPFAAVYILRAVMQVGFGKAHSVEKERPNFDRKTSVMEETDGDGLWERNELSKRKEATSQGKDRATKLATNGKYRAYEWVPAVILLGFIIGLGVYPQWVIDVLSETVMKIGTGG